MAGRKRKATASARKTPKSTPTRRRSARNRKEVASSDAEDTDSSEVVTIHSDTDTDTDNEYEPRASKRLRRGSSNTSVQGRNRRNKSIPNSIEVVTISSEDEDVEPQPQVSNTRRSARPTISVRNIVADVRRKERQTRETTDVITINSNPNSDSEEPLTVVTPPVSVKVKRPNRRMASPTQNAPAVTPPIRKQVPEAKQVVIRLVRYSEEELGLLSPTLDPVEAQDKDSLNESSIAELDIEQEDQLETTKMDASMALENQNESTAPRIAELDINEILTSLDVNETLEIMGQIERANQEEDQRDESDFCSIAELGIQDERELRIGEESQMASQEEKPFESKFCSIADDLDIDNEEKLLILDSAEDLDLDNRQRLQCFLHSGLKFRTVRSLMQRISMNSVDDVAVWAVCDLVKDYVEDIMNIALDFDEACGESGPLSPIAIIAASYKMKLEERTDASDVADSAN